MRLTAAETEAADRILRAIRAHCAERGYPPTQRDLAAACNYPLSAVNRYLRIMAVHGLITVEPRQARGIRLVEADGA